MADGLRNLFLHAIERDFQMILVFEDDAVPHCDFDNMLRELLSDLRCGGHLYTENKGGVLQLGATVWGRRAWQNIETDIYAYVVFEHKACENIL